MKKNKEKRKKKTESGLMQWGIWASLGYTKSISVDLIAGKAKVGRCLAMNNPKKLDRKPNR